MSFLSDGMQRSYIEILENRYEVLKYNAKGLAK